jgi:hypothetical protein
MKVGSKRRRRGTRTLAALLLVAAALIPAARAEDGVTADTVVIGRPPASPARSPRRSRK